METVQDFPRKTVTETRDLTDQVSGLPLSQVIANLTAAMTDLDPSVQLQMGSNTTEWRMRSLFKLSWERDETDQEWRDRAQRTLNNRAGKARKKAAKKRAKEEHEARMAQRQTAQSQIAVVDTHQRVDEVGVITVRPRGLQWFDDDLYAEMPFRPITHLEEEDHES